MAAVFVLKLTEQDPQGGVIKKGSQPGEGGCTLLKTEGFNHLACAMAYERNHLECQHRLASFRLLITVARLRKFFC